MNNIESNLEFGFAAGHEEAPRLKSPLDEQLAAFNEFGKSTRVRETKVVTFDGAPLSVPTYVNEYWTSKQRAANSLHEISYRACFKPQLPRFFIQRLTGQGDIVFDPFMGRGTTLIEAGLLGRTPSGCDINPLSTVLTRPRLHPPTMDQVIRRLAQIDFNTANEMPEELLVFYHPETLREICGLRNYLITRLARAESDLIDDWIRMVAVSRLTGHSPGYFSVYTLPPNQATSMVAQRRINKKRGKQPELRHVAEIIARKSQQLLSDCDAAVRLALSRIADRAQVLSQHSGKVAEIGSNTVALVVTSPPYLDTVDYAGDNWLRCWFIGVDPDSVKLTVPKKLVVWQCAMTEVMHELHRILRPGGHVAFEVGEVRGGKIKLEEAVLTCGVAAGLSPLLIMINEQQFTKTANCWGVDNNSKGTNTNRIVVFRKSAL